MKYSPCARRKHINIRAKQAALTKQYDQRILKAWRHVKANGTLLAIGGYGRGELFPHSDIDLLIINTASNQNHAAYQQFVQYLWDQGFQVGHSVRTLEQCLEDAKQDSHFYTSLLEARELTQQHGLLATLQNTLQQEHYHPFAAFYQEKRYEQLERQERFAHNLQPNIKKCPGGLRDIHIIRWLALRYFKKNDIRVWLKHGFLHWKEYIKTAQAYDFLQSLRFALHELTGYAENRLLFEYQKSLAQQFGFQDNERQLAVEQFMQKFYRATRQIEVINEIILQQAAELLVINDNITPIDQDFQIRFNQLDLIDHHGFTKNPTLLLKAFVTLGKHSNINGFSAQTIRLMHEALPLIDDAFRHNPINQQLFLGLFNLDDGIYHQCTKMVYYQIMQRYLPDFEHLIGQMQFDLYHTYTVDVHTLKVIGQCRKLALRELNDTLPEATQVFHQLDDPKLLYLAALFHDIGKGRGVDHSQWGAQAIIKFAQQHKLPQDDVALLGWLVKHHLTMSSTAQKTDITDPLVVERFAKRVKNQRYLNYLYVLTICDMRGTNMTLWNGWKKSLLDTLYHATQYYFETQQIQPPEDEQIVQTAWKRLTLEQQQKLTEIWPLVTQLYTENLTLNTLTWRVNQLLTPDFPHTPCVAIRLNPEHGEWEIFIVMERSIPYVYSRVSHTLEMFGLAILDAQGQSTATLICGQFIINEPEQPQALISAIQQSLQTPTLPTPLKTRKKNDSLHFDIESHIDIQPTGDQHKIAIRTADRPGLLADICKVLSYYQLRIKQMRITTLGEKVEDIFWVQPERSANWQKISSALKQVIK